MKTRTVIAEEPRVLAGTVDGVGWHMRLACGHTKDSVDRARVGTKVPCVDCTKEARPP